MSDDIPSAHHITVVACQHDLIEEHIGPQPGDPVH